MTDKKLDLDDIEEEGQEQQREADQLRQDVEQHGYRVEKLDETMSELRDQQEELKSGGLEMAILEIERAKQESEKKIQEAREKRDNLLEENRRMSEKVTTAFEQRKQSTQKLAILRMGVQGVAAGELQAASDALEIDLNRLGFADALLKQAKTRLEAIDI